MEKLLELKSISAGYTDKIVLEDIDLVIYKNDFLGMIGPNGGGKTTLLRVILKLLKPFKGKLEFYGKASQKIKLGYLPQFKVIDQQFPIQVIDVVLSGLMSGRRIFKRFTQRDRFQGIEILDKLGAAHLKNKVIGELSGGQMQRVFLGRALVSNPELLILDEPATFVDQNFSRNLNDILKELNKKMAIVLVSHDIGTIISSVKNIACVNGRLHYHHSDEFGTELLEEYQCSFRIVGHGDLPHTVLKKHRHL